MRWVSFFAQKICQMHARAVLGRPVLATVMEEIVLAAQTGWTPELDKRVVRNIHRFSPRQVCLLLGCLGRVADRRPSDRRLVHQLSSQLVPEALSLRDFAVAGHALWKLGVRNELFFLSNSDRVCRQILFNPNNVSTLVLILGAYVRLGMVGDGKVVRAVLSVLERSCVGRVGGVGTVGGVGGVGSEKDICSEPSESVDLSTTPTSLDAVTLLNIVTKMDEQLRTEWAALLTPLADLVSPDHAAAALVAAAKLGTPLPQIPKWESDFLSQLPSMPQFRQIHGFHALAILHSSHVSSVLSEIAKGTLAQLPPSLTMLLLTGMNRAAELLPLELVVSVLNDKLEGLSQTSDVGIAAAYLNLLATINLQPPLELRLPTPCSSSQSVALIVTALSKLDLKSRLSQLFAELSPTDLVPGMSSQGIDMCLLAVAKLSADQRMRVPHVQSWLDRLVVVKRARKPDLSKQSLGQMRVFRVLMAQESVNERPTSAEDAFASSGVVSNLHTQVAATLTGLGLKFKVNRVEPTTGYEIDLAMAPIHSENS